MKILNKDMDELRRQNTHMALKFLNKEEQILHFLSKKLTMVVIGIVPVAIKKTKV